MGPVWTGKSMRRTARVSCRPHTSRQPRRAAVRGILVIACRLVGRDRAAAASQCRQLVSDVEQGILSGWPTFAIGLRPADRASGAFAAVIVVGKPVRHALGLCGLKSDDNCRFHRTDDGAVVADRAANRAWGLCSMGADGSDGTKAGCSIARSGHLGTAADRSATAGLLGDAASTSETAHTAKGP